MRDRIMLIDFLKGYSITTIVLYHLIIGTVGLPSVIYTASSFGGAGVHVFFVCSGFGLFLSYKKRPLSYWEFLKKRFSKVYFPYIAVVFVSFLFSFTGNYPKRLEALLSHVFLYKMFSPEFMGSFGNQMWFVSVIFQFYFVFVFIARIFRKIGSKNFFILSFAVSLSWWITVILAGKSDERVWNSFFLQYLWEFSLGMILADYFTGKNSLYLPPQKTLVIAAAAGITFLGVTGVVGGVMRTFNDIPSLIGYGALALLIYSISRQLFRPEAKPVPKPKTHSHPIRHNHPLPLYARGRRF